MSLIKLQRNSISVRNLTPKEEVILRKLLKGKTNKKPCQKHFA